MSLHLSIQAPHMSCCEISDLSDEDLAEVFKHLPPHDRLLTSLVCKRWHRINKLTWLDLTSLDLSHVPSSNIGAIIKRSPNLHIVSAARETFYPDALHSLSLANLSSLKLYDCTAVIWDAQNRIIDVMRTLFSDRLPTANWEELVLHGLKVELQPSVRQSEPQLPATFLPVSLKRLQLSGVQFSSRTSSGSLHYGFPSSLRGLEQLRELECLMLHCSPLDNVITQTFQAMNHLHDVAFLQNLRELYLSNQCGRYLAQGELLRLPQLRVLFLHRLVFPENVFDLLTAKRPPLRILAITGYFGPIEIDFPARIQYGNRFDEDPLPQLHIFVGKSASEKIRFPSFPSYAAKVHPINQPLPVFLERTDIKKIFDGVWIAEKIKEAARRGATLHDYGEDVTTGFRLVGNG